MASQIDIWNNALSEVAAERVNSTDEASLQAAECRRIWPGLVDEFLSWTAWECQYARVVLASEANDRAGEWLYRYAKPADMAEIIEIVPAYAAGLTIAPGAGPFATPQIRALGRLPYTLSDTSIYTNVADAALAYVSSTLQVGRILPAARRALELELASRLAVPIKKSREMKGDLIKQAELARSRAVAEHMNRTYSYDTNFISAAQFARAGYQEPGLYGGE